MQILLVDDDPMISETLGHLLRLLHHAVIVRSGPAEAIHHLREHPADVVLLDWFMPGGGGCRVLDAMADGSIPTVPVILVTGSPEEQWREERANMLVLHKPFRLATLQGLLAQVAAGKAP